MLLFAFPLHYFYFSSSSSSSYLIESTMRSCLINARSLRNKYINLETLTANGEYHNIGVAETWINTENRDYLAEYQLPGYTLVPSERLYTLLRFPDPTVNGEVESLNHLLGMALVVDSLPSCLVAVLVMLFFSYSLPHKFPCNFYMLYGFPVSCQPKLEVLVGGEEPLPLLSCSL